MFDHNFKKNALHRTPCGGYNLNLYDPSSLGLSTFLDSSAQTPHVTCLDLDGNNVSESLLQRCTPIPPPQLEP